MSEPSAAVLAGIAADVRNTLREVRDLKKEFAEHEARHISELRAQVEEDVHLAGRMATLEADVKAVGSPVDHERRISKLEGAVSTRSWLGAVGILLSGVFAGVLRIAGVPTSGGQGQ